MNRPLSLASAVVALSLGAACVPQAAGYHDVQALTSNRVGEQVHWRQHESTAELDDTTKKLLAQPLSADSAVRIALLNNESLQATFEKLGIARGQLQHALRLPNPSVGAALRYGADERPEIDLDATLSLSELLFIGWRNGAAQADFEADKIEVVQGALRVAFEARSQFYDYTAAAEELELRRSVLGALRASADMADRQRKAGNITALALANEQALYEEARVAFARAEASQLSQREALNATMGLWGERGAHWSAESRLPEPTPIASLLKDVEQRVVERSLDLRHSRERFAAAARRVNLSRIEGWVPELHAGVTAERAEQDWSIGPLVELELPLFYQGQAETSAAIAEMRREQRLFADTAVRLRARARSLAIALQTAAESVSYYKQTLLPLREQIVTETQLEYNAMSIGVFQLLQAKRDQIASAQAYVGVVHDYWRLRTEVEQLLAGRLSEGASVSAPPNDAAPARAEAAGH